MQTAIIAIPENRVTTCAATVADSAVGLRRSAINPANRYPNPPSQAAVAGNRNGQQQPATQANAEDPQQWGGSFALSDGMPNRDQKDERRNPNQPRHAERRVKHDPAIDPKGRRIDQVGASGNQ